MNFIEYPAYKDSGSSWLGRVPKDWDIEKLKYLCKVNPSGIMKNTASDNLVSFLPMEKVSEKGTYELDSNRPYEEVATGFTCFANGDVIVAKITPCFENGKGAMLEGLTNGVGCGSTEFHVLRAIKKKATAKFIYYVTISHLFRNTGQRFMKGVAGQQRVPADFIEKFSTCLPNISEQNSIVSFLENEIRRIEQLTNCYYQSMSLLQEKRQTIISQAVTRGLNPNVQMKDSGVDWIGTIPQHWKISKLKYISKIKTGDKNTEDSTENGAYPFFVRSQKVEHLNSYAFEGEAVLTAGDGVGVGKVFHYYIGKFDYHQRVYAITNFKGVLGKFVFYYLKVNLIKEMLRYNAKSTVDSLRLPMFREFVIAFPNNVKEQEEIINYIDRETSKIDLLSQIITKQIDLLNEYKVSLISHAVTGKIDVRGHA